MAAYEDRFDTTPNVLTLSLSSDYTILDDDGYGTFVFDAGGADRVINLPDAASNDGRKLIFKKTDADTSDALVLTGAGGDLIDGVASRRMTGENTAYTLISSGTEWQVIDRQWDQTSVAFTPAMGGIGGDPTFSGGTKVGSIWREGDRCYITWFWDIGGFTGNGNVAYLVRPPLISGLAVQGDVLGFMEWYDAPNSKLASVRISSNQMIFVNDGALRTTNSFVNGDQISAKIDVKITEWVE